MSAAEPPAVGADTIRVATEALRTEAQVWNAQAVAMHDIATTVGAMRRSNLEAGIFAVFQRAYTELVDRVVAYSAEGAERMVAIATTLRATAQTYDEEERTHVHALTHLY